MGKRHSGGSTTIHNLLLNQLFPLDPRPIKIFRPANYFRIDNYNNFGRYDNAIHYNASCYVSIRRFFLGYAGHLDVL